MVFSLGAMAYVATSMAEGSAAACIVLHVQISEIVLVSRYGWQIPRPQQCLVAVLHHLLSYEDVAKHAGKYQSGRLSCTPQVCIGKFLQLYLKGFVDPSWIATNARHRAISVGHAG